MNYIWPPHWLIDLFWVYLTPPVAPSSSSSDNSVVADCIDWMSSAVIANPASFAITRAASTSATPLSFSWRLVSPLTFSRNALSYSSEIWLLFDCFRYTTRIQLSRLWYLTVMMPDIEGWFVGLLAWLKKWKLPEIAGSLKVGLWYLGT